MFERNRIETGSQVPQALVPVEIVLSEGAVERGRIAVSQSRPLAEHLNSAAPFLEFEPYGGERLWISKSTIRQIKVVNVPAAPQLNARSCDGEAFDPFSILRLARTASWDEIRAAYHRLAKVYHPDRFAGVELPEEVKGYVEATSRRINAAFAALEVQHQERVRAAERSRPVYTSPGAR